MAELLQICTDETSPDKTDQLTSLSYTLLSTETVQTHIGIFRFLHKLGVPEWRSWLITLSGKGWWRLSSTPQVHEAMNKKWFESIGLFVLEIKYLRLKFEETTVYASTH